METFNTLLTLSELKAHYSDKPVGICPLYKGSIGATKTFETAGNPVVLPEYVALEKLNIEFSPKQAGSGDPSPDNVRSITGWESVKVTVSNGDESHDYDVTLHETVYGGTVDGVTGVGSVRYVYRELSVMDMNNTDDFPGWKNQSWLAQAIPGEIKDSTLANLGCEGIINITPILDFRINKVFDLYLYASPIFSGLTQSQIKAQFPDLVVQFCLKLNAPEPFEASKISIPSLGSENKFFTNGENLDIIYKVSSFWG